MTDAGFSKKPTLKDVARVVGVSVNTVSAILNGGTKANRYSESTCERVRLAAEELGYMPNPLARTLKRTRTRLLGVVVISQQDSYYASVLQAAETVVLDAGYEFVLADMSEDAGRLPQCLNLLTAWRVEGILAVLGGHDVDRVPLTQVWDAGTPVVLVGAHHPEDPFPCLYLDNTGAARQIGQHLAQLGHERVGILGGYESNAHSTERIEGLRSVFAELGTPIPDSCVVLHRERNYELAAGYQDVQLLLDRAPEVTAMVCVNDATAIGAMTRLHELGYSVPQDMSVSGFDDLFLGNASKPANRLGLHVRPALTTLRMPVTGIGRHAGEALTRLVGAAPGDVDRDQPPTEFGAELVVRDSTAAPRSGRRGTASSA